MPITSRILAALIDYLVIFSLFMLLGKPLGALDLQWVVSLLAGTLYFGLCHSRLLDGQTLGKRAFGLSLVQTRPEADGTFLAPNFRTSLARYFLNHGALIVLLEIPPLYFRAQALEAPPLCLDAPRLIAIAWFAALVLSTLFNPLQRGLHDLLAGTRVVRSTDSLAVIQAAFDAAEYRRRSLPALATAVLFAAVVGHLSGPQTPLESAIARAHYRLEQQAALRLLRVSEDGSVLKVDVVILSAATDLSSSLAPLSAEISKLNTAGNSKLHKISYQALFAAEAEPSWQSLEVSLADQLK